MLEEQLQTKFLNLSLPPLQCVIGSQFISYVNEDIKKRFILGGTDIFSNSSTGISCAIKFIDFERSSLDSSQKTLQQSELRSSIRPYIHNKIMPYNFGVNIYDKFPLHLKNEKDVNRLLYLIEQFYYQDAKPFFEYWQDIRMFLPFVEEDNEAAIELLGNNYILRKMALWKLCDHPRYDKFVTQRVSILDNALQDDPENEDYMSVLKEINIKYEELKNVKSSYEWNPENLIIKPFKPNEA